MSEAPPPASQMPRWTWARIARRIRVPLGFLSAAFFIWLARPTRTSLIAGSLVMVPGLILRGFASGHVQKDKQLTTSGPYAHTRNPLYLGSLLLAAGFAIAARSWWVVAIMFWTLLLIYVPVVVAEERYLRTAFPEYDDYARHVPRLFPRFTPYGSSTSAYSSERYWKHHEYEASIGCVVMLAILIVKLVIR
ncbi:MAG: isoprenylcysteine carboxylmethyltransferase family protein [Terriglobales bacterium]